MNIEDPEAIQLELKYCERCGALWLRLRGAQQIYCAPVRPGGAGLAHPAQSDQPAAPARKPQD